VRKNGETLISIRFATAAFATITAAGLFGCGRRWRRRQQPAPGSPYAIGGTVTGLNVSVLTQPTNPSQTCTVSSGSARWVRVT